MEQPPNFVLLLPAVGVDSGSPHALLWRHTHGG